MINYFFKCRQNIQSGSLYRIPAAVQRRISPGRLLHSFPVVKRGLPEVGVAQRVRHCGWPLPLVKRGLCTATLLLLMFGSGLSSATETIKNLGDLELREKSSLRKSVDSIAVGQHEAYPLSVALIASAQLGDWDTYQPVSEKINAELAKMEANSAFKLWMLGRVLFAADSIGDQSGAESAQEQLAHHLTDTDVTSMSTSSLDFAMFSWACGYYAAISKQNYQAIEPKMRATIDRLMEFSLQNPAAHEALSNAVWALVMALNASANAGDQENHEQLLGRLLRVTGKKTVASALDSALTRTAESSDYPAWAFGIVQLSAATIGNRHLYNTLAGPLRSSLKASAFWARLPGQTQANHWKSGSEIVLGKLSSILAAERSPHSIAKVWRSHERDNRM